MLFPWNIKLTWVSNSDLMWARLIMKNTLVKLTLNQLLFATTLFRNFLQMNWFATYIRDLACSCGILMSSLEILNVDTSSTTLKKTMDFIPSDLKADLNLYFWMTPFYHTPIEPFLICRRSLLEKSKIIWVCLNGKHYKT